VSARAEDRRSVLTGPAIAAIAPLLDGTRTLGALATESGAPPSRLRARSTASRGSASWSRAHLDAGVAARRAVDEIGQTLHVMDAAPEERAALRGPANEELERWLGEATLEGEPWLVPDPEAPARSRSDQGGEASADLVADVGTCVERLRAAGLELIVVDQSRPDVELVVVKAIVPSLRHFWRRLAPGRLYDVPVKLGWLDRPRTEDDLNPVAMFL